jgi:hypothetical protein
MERFNSLSVKKERGSYASNMTKCDDLERD